VGIKFANGHVIYLNNTLCSFVFNCKVRYTILLSIPAQFLQWYICILTGNNGLVDIFESNLRKSYELIRSNCDENEWPPNQPKKIIQVMHRTIVKGQKGVVFQQFKVGSPAVHQMISNGSKVVGMACY